MNFSTLVATKATVGSICFWINYARIDAESNLRDAENWISINLRVRRMRKRAELTLVSGASEIDLAADVPNFLDPIRLWMKGYGLLTLIHEDDIDEARAADTDGGLTSGSPSRWTTSGTTLLLDTEADQSYLLVLSHYAKPVPLSLTNETNIFTDEYPALLKAVASAYAYIEAKDEQRAKALFDHAARFIETIAANDDLARRGMEFETEVA